MPNGDGTGPDGKGPKKKNKGWPEKNGKGQCKQKRNCKNGSFKMSGTRKNIGTRDDKHI